MPEHEHFRSAFLEWIDATKAGKASCRDRRFRDTSGKEFPTAYLMGYMSTNPDALPDDHAWIVTDNPALIGRQAERSYENAVRVVKAQRLQ
ncbi:MAG: hypothetical protein M3Q45_02540 [Chloroflexota bacterium]|nr:hypothetical protein [Chloroflexota bacterium]